MADTTKRSLPLMAGTDLAATIDDTYDAALEILDEATFYLEGSFASRPDAATAVQGTFFKPTDLPGYLYLSDGADWIEVAPGMGSVPIGSSLEWWAASDPGDTRFVRMDGRALSTTTYATLYALIGDTYNTFRGATAPNPGLFRIPNVAGLTVVGAGTGNGLTSRTLGASGGEENHQLTAAEGPKHTHPMVTPFVQHNVAAGGDFTVFGGSGGSPTVITIGYNSSADATAHNNMQPYVVANRIMRIT